MTKINRKPSYGMLGKNHSIETRKKISETHLKKGTNKGKHLSPKTEFKKGFKVLRLWENEIKKMTLNDFQNKLMEKKNGI